MCIVDSYNVYALFDHISLYSMLEVGLQAPDFTMPNQNGDMVSLHDYRGKKVILYFYPKDNTKGCTMQAQEFARLQEQFAAENAVIIGVSKDSVASHKKFEEQHQLPFTLISDPELTVIQAYDVWGEKNMYGKKTMGLIRSTYVIDEAGIIIGAFGNVRAAKNPEKMLEEISK